MAQTQLTALRQETAHVEDQFTVSQTQLTTFRQEIADLECQLVASQEVPAANSIDPQCHSFLQRRVSQTAQETRLVSNRLQSILDGNPVSPLDEVDVDRRSERPFQMLEEGLMAVSQQMFVLVGNQLALAEDATAEERRAERAEACIKEQGEQLEAAHRAIEAAAANETASDVHAKTIEAYEIRELCALQEARVATEAKAKTDKELFALQTKLAEKEESIKAEVAAAVQKAVNEAIVAEREAQQYLAMEADPAPRTPTVCAFAAPTL